MEVFSEATAEATAAESSEPLFADEAPPSESELKGDAPEAEPEAASLPVAETDREAERPDWLDPDTLVPVPDAPPDRWQGFKILSDTEFEALRDEDPEEAIVYLRRENQFKEHRQRQAIEQESARSFEERILDDAWKQIQQVIPNALEKDRPEVQETIRELNAVARETGITERELAILTNPATRVVVRGRDGKDRVALLGTAAAAVVRLISKLPKASRSAGKATSKPGKASGKPAPSPRRSNGFAPLFADEATFTEDELRGV